MSQISARRIAKSHAAQNHWIAERLLDRSGIPVTHLRPTLFAEWLMYLSQTIREKHIIPLAFGNARYAPIAGEDNYLRPDGDRSLQGNVEGYGVYPPFPAAYG